MKRGWKPPKCRTNKAAFPSGGAARRKLDQIHITEIQAAAHANVTPQREYKCEFCGAWHLTSQDDRHGATS